MSNRTITRTCCLTMFAAANLLYAQDKLIVVSAAGSQSVVAPGALATVYGQFAVEPAIGILNTLGLFPTELAGMAVDFNGEPAQLLFVGPEQINFIVPSDAGFGAAALSVNTSSAAMKTTATIQPVAPSIFTTIRNGRELGAILNAVTFQADPFPLETSEIPGCDNRTRLAVYATGLGLATKRAKARDVSVELIDASGTTYQAEVATALPAPGYTGLDQVNFTVPASLHPGTVLMRLIVNGVPSNQVQFDVTGPALSANAASATTTCLGNIVIARSAAQSATPFEATVSLTNPAAADVAVNLLTDDGVTIPSTVTVPAGQVSAKVPVAVNNSSSPFRVIAVLNGASRLASFEPGQACVRGISLSSGGIVAGNNLKGAVMLTDPAPSSGMTVNLVSNNSLVGLAPAVTVSSGQMSMQFDITTAMAVSPAKAILTAAGSCGGTSTPLNLVLSACISSVSLSSSSVTGSGKITGTVKLNAPSLAGGTVVNITTSDPSLQSDVATLRVPEGETTATFSINASAVSARTLATVTASVGTCGTASAAVTLMPR
ncbi:MAG TPA: hypothetical protein VKE70_15450 [Candidatus Solibacter sp.]|nr:hypothetical protein [Candidatus Solibacter sp.]